MSILTQLRKMNNSIRYTKEDKQIFREKTLEMLRKGIRQNEIARKIGVSAQYISNLKNSLIKEGLITQKEIDEKKVEVLEKNREEKKRVSKKKSKDELNQEIKRRRNIVLEKYKEGKTQVEITRELGIPRTTICRDEKWLIEEGLILKEEIVTQRSLNAIERKRKEAEIRKLLSQGNMTRKEIAREVNVSDAIVSYVATNNLDKIRKKKTRKTKKEKQTSIHNPEALNNLQSIEKDVYNELRKGYQYNYIEKKLGISHKKCMAIVEVLHITGVFGRKDIKEARNALRIRDKREILTLLKQGYSQSSIINLKRYLNVASCSRIVTELKEEGKITEEEIKAAQVESNRKYEMLVLRGMQQGLTVKEIIASDEDGYLTESIARRIKNNLIEKGLIRKKIFKNRNSKRIRQLLDASRKEHDAEYIRLLKKGLTFEEIANLEQITYKNARAKWYRINAKYQIGKGKLEEWREKRDKNFEDGKKALDSYIKLGIGVKKVQKFFETCIEEKGYGRAFSEEEAEKFGRVILMDEAFLNKNNLKFVIFLYIEHVPSKKTKAYLNMLLRFYSDTEYNYAIKDFISYFYNATKHTKQQIQDDGNDEHSIE